MMRALFLPGLVLLLAAVGQDLPVVRVDVELVLVEVEVVNSDGRLVHGLGREDFTITDNGHRQEIRSFSLQRIPYRALVLVDCSGSISEGGHFVSNAVRSFIDRLGSLDHAGVAAFGRSAEILIDWTRRDQWAKDVEIPSGTPLCTESNVYGNIASVVDHLRKLSGRRGALIITDGIHSAVPVRSEKIASFNVGRIVDTSDDPEFQRLLRIVRQSYVPLYFAALNTDLNPIPMSAMLQPATDYSPLAVYNLQQVRARLEQLAAVSGGRVVYPRSPEDYAPLFERIESDLGYLYSLGYTPPDLTDGKNHRIEVRVRGNGLRVRQSRQEYNALAR